MTGTAGVYADYKKAHARMRMKASDLLLHELLEQAGISEYAYLYLFPTRKASCQNIS
jgi:hypothetical protein